METEIWKLSPNFWRMVECGQLRRKTTMMAIMRKRRMMKMKTEMKRRAKIIKTLMRMLVKYACMSYKNIIFKKVTLT